VVEVGHTLTYLRDRVASMSLELQRNMGRGKDKYLACWKRFIAESNTWEGRENLENTKEAIEAYEREYPQDMENIRRQE